MSLTTEVQEEPQSEPLELPKIPEPKKLKSKNERNIKTIDELKNEAVEKLKKPTKFKFTVYGKVNSKGIRYEVTKIIEADDKDIASSIYKERIKKEFEGIRNITCVKPELYKNGDTEYSKEIELPKASEPEEKEDIPEFVLNGKSIKMPKDMTNIEFGFIAFYLITLKLHDLKMYTCYYSPKKKLNNSYRKNNLLVYVSFNEIDAMHDIKKETLEQGVPFKEKYVHELKEVTIENALSSDTIRKRILLNGKEKYGTLEKAYEEVKNEVLKSPKAQTVLKEAADKCLT